MSANFASSKRRDRQQGAVAIIVALILLAMLGIGAFAIDIGRWLVVRNELQNGSDASALAGAGYLFPRAPANIVWEAPDWDEAVRQAGLAIPLNTSENTALATGVVIPGWWNFATRTFDSDTLRAPTGDDLPAVRVTLTKRDGENAGPVAMFFGRLFGVESIDARATATAVISVPVSAGPGALMPFAISDCMFSPSAGLWDSANNAPIIPAGQSEPPPFMVASGAASGTLCGPCNCGQWTSLGLTLNDAQSIRRLINGELLSPPVTVGGTTYIQPGVQATLYGFVDRTLVGQTVAVPIVANGSLNQKGDLEVQGFACLKIEKGVQGGPIASVCKTLDGDPVVGGYETNQCIIGRFSTETCLLPGAGGGAGTFTGTIVPPRLVQ